MEKIQFDDTTFIWKDKLNLVEDKSIFLNEAYDIIKSQPGTKFDGFGYKKLWNNSNDLNFNGDFTLQTGLDKILKIGIDRCKELYNENNIPYNKINVETWVNVVRSKNPVQIQFKHNEIKGIDKYHTHTDINKIMESFVPNYTYVYYIQMPDVMNGEDGVLYFRGNTGIEHWVLPEEDDLIIMPGDMPHAPNNAPNSTIDRIVVAGNIGFEMVKKEKSLL